MRVGVNLDLDPIRDVPARPVDRTCRLVTKYRHASRSKKNLLAPVSSWVPKKVETRAVVSSRDSIMAIGN
jgi:hypothetical protein